MVSIWIISQLLKFLKESKTLKDKYRRNSEIIKKQEKLLTDKDSDIKVFTLV